MKINENIELYLGDCLEEMKKLPDKSVDLVLTDPPYGLNFSYEGYDDTRDNLKNLIKYFIPEFIRIAKRTVVLCGPTQISLYPQVNWVGSIVWNTTGSFGKCGYNQWTPFLLYGEDIKGFGNINGITKSDVLRISGGGGVGFTRSKEEKEHTCPKPITMMKLVVQRFSNENDTILDPFMGSGTTGVACVKLNRKFIGMEISPEYFEISRKRISDELRQTKLL